MARKRGKKYLDTVKQNDFTKVYSPEEALSLVLKTNTAKFTETVEIAMKLGVDPRHADQQVRGTVILPNGTGKDVKILVITQGENEEKAKEAGADYVGSDEFIEKIKNGWFEFDLVVATPDMMPKLGRLGKILGTKGLMPNPKSGTVTTDVAKTVEEFKKGKLAFRIDKLASLHSILGKADFSEEKISENFKAFLREIIRLKPSSSKGQYLRSITLSLTMGPGVKIDPILAQSFIEE